MCRRGLTNCSPVRILIQSDCTMEHFSKNWKEVAEQRQILDQETDQRIWTAISKKTGKGYWRVAAAMLLLPLAGLLFYLYTSQQPFREHSAYRSGEAPESYRLPDGSEITLEAGSTLTLSEGFGVNNRQVTFEGKAYFDIAKDPDKPFIINARSFEVQVLGTRFFLDQTSGEKRVELFEGKVEIAHDGEKVTLAPREIWVKDENNESYLFNSPEVVNDFTFDNENYDQVIQKLEKTYGVRIDYPGEFKTKKISGSFNGSLNDVLSIISHPFNLKPVRINEKQIELK